MGLYGIACRVIASLIILAAAAAPSPFRPLPEDGPVRAEMSKDTEEGRAGLPYAFGRRFRTLDEYLVHLRQRAAPIDLPWWRQIGPDRYERVTSIRPAGKRERATRAELMRRFGFSR